MQKKRRKVYFIHALPLDGGLDPLIQERLVFSRGYIFNYWFVLGVFFALISDTFISLTLRKHTSY